MCENESPTGHLSMQNTINGRDGSVRKSSQGYIRPTNPEAEKSIKLKCLKLDDESGLALLMVLLVSVLLFGLSLSIVVNSMFELEIASNNERGLLAFYAAQTGMESAVNLFRNSYNTTNLPGNGATLYNNIAEIGRATCRERVKT